MKHISVVIPVLNENVHSIRSLVTVLKKASNILEVILVNDGSHNQFDQAYKQIPGIVYIKHSKNKGKTEACLTGYKKSRGLFIAFIDADIHGISTKEIESLSLLCTSYDIIRLYRGGAKGIRKALGIPYIIGGEIVMARSIVQTYESYIFHGATWQLEYRINDVMIAHKKRSAIAYMPHMEHTMKWKKAWPIREYLQVEWGAFLDCFVKNGGLFRFIYYKIALAPLIQNKIIVK